MARTGPTSIRFDPEKLELVKKKEKVDTAQKAVDFLMDTYWWKNKLSRGLPDQPAPEVKQEEEKEKGDNDFEHYDLAISKAQDCADLESIGSVMGSDVSLSYINKKTLIALAKEKAKKFNC